MAGPCVARFIVRLKDDEVELRSDSEPLTRLLPILGMTSFSVAERAVGGHLKLPHKPRLA